MAVGVFSLFCTLFLRAVLGGYFWVLIAPYLPCLKAKTSERSQQGTGRAALAKRASMGRDESRGPARGEPRGGPREGAGRISASCIGMLGLREPRGDAGRERKTWNLLPPATEESSTVTHAALGVAFGCPLVWVTALSQGLG